MESRFVPELRFPEFKGEWEGKKTSEIAPLQRGFDLLTTNVTSGAYPIVYSNGILRKHNDFKVKAPGVVTGRSGTIGKVTYVEEDFWPHNTSLWVTNFYNNIPKFIYYFYLRFKLEKYSAGSTVPTLNRNDIHFVKKCLPTPLEQTKIATFLTAVDKQIGLLKEKKKLLEQYKKGLMQKIFSQEIRFKDDNGNDFPDWKEKRLGDLGTTYNGLSGKTKVDFGEGKFYIQYMQVFNDSRIDTSNFGLVHIGVGEKQNLAQYGDIFFTISSETPNEIGTSSVLSEHINEVYLNSFCFGYRPNSLDKLVPRFSQFFFRSNKVRKEIIKLAQGSTRFNMSKAELMKLKFDLPQKAEQEVIANFLLLVNVSIKKMSNQIDYSVVFKQGLLQKMFM